MNWNEPLTATAFERWLVAVAGGAQIRQGRRLDPFVTSMRKFALVSPWLEAVELGGEPPQRGGGGGQATIDLRAAGLVTTAGHTTLSDLGRECLAGWRAAEVANAEDEGELVRSLIAVIAGVRLGVPEYLEMVRFWKQLRVVYDADALLASPNWLYLVSYLNQERDGYNPWRAITVQEVNQPGDFDFEWATLAGRLTQPAAMTAAQNLLGRVHDYGTRSFGRTEFCMAMELHSLAEARDFDSVTTRLRAWRLPND